MTGADIGLIVSTFLTLATLSWLYRDNPFYRLAEHLFIGVALGYVLVLQVHDVLRPKLYDVIVGDADPVMNAGWYVGLALLCALMLTRWVPRVGWLSRIPFAIVVGAVVGLAAQGYARAVFVPQLGSTLEDVLPTPLAVDALHACLQRGGPLAGVRCRHGAWIEGVLVALIVVVSLAYLHGVRAPGNLRRPLRGLRETGRWVVLVGFGAVFGFVGMEHIAVAAGRAELLMTSPGATLLGLLLIIGGLGLWGRTLGGPREPESTEPRR